MELVKILYLNQEYCVGGSGTELEICSLKKITENKDVMNKLSKKPYITKLTTKYKLPELCTEMNKAIESNAEIINQDLNNKNWQNTELWTFATSKFKEFMLEIDNQSGLLEERISRLCKNKNIHRLPSLKNEAKYKRGVGDYLKYL